MSICLYNLCGKTLSGQQTHYCSKVCSNKFQVRAWRRRTKLRAISYLGGKCKLCGYDRCSDAMDFHHRDSLTKDFEIGRFSGGWTKIKAELDKCDLLCANCHRETHANINKGALEHVGS